MKKFIVLSLLFVVASMHICAQKCNVQGIVQYYYNDYIGFRADTGSEVYFIKYSSVHKVPTRQKWEKYQDMVEKRIKYTMLHRYLNRDEAEQHSGYKQEFEDSIQTLGGELLLERLLIEEEGLAKYTAVVDASGKYEISVPYGTYYILIKSKNRKIMTPLEALNRYHMERVVLKSSTKVVSFDFNIIR